jgi:hypothetical protein
MIKIFDEHVNIPESVIDAEKNCVQKWAWKSFVDDIIKDITGGEWDTIDTLKTWILNDRVIINREYRIPIILVRFAVSEALDIIDAISDPVKARDHFVAWIDSKDDMMISRDDVIEFLRHYPGDEWVTGMRVICSRNDEPVAKSYLLEKFDVLSVPGGYKKIFDRESVERFDAAREQSRAGITFK